VGLNVLLAVLLVGALVVMANYLAARHFWRWQWARGVEQTLSPQTLRLLDTLRSQTNELKVVVYFDRQEALFGSVKSLLAEYELRCPKFRVDYVDYTMQVGKAALVKARYSLAADARDLVVFDLGGRVKIVYDKELYDLDFSRFNQTREATRSTFKGEIAFSSALVSVMDTRQFKACLLQGHGEHDPESEDDMMGYAKFVRLLREKNIEVSTLSLLGTNEVPAECQLLVVAGPRTPIATAEREKIERHLSAGGRLLVLLNFQGRYASTGIESILKSWGIEVGRNVVSDRPQAQSGQVEAVASAKFGNHPIVNPLHGTRLSLVMPGTVSGKGGSQNADAPKVAELVFSSDQAFAIEKIGGASGAPEHRGALPLAVAAERGSIQGVSGDRGSSRLVVVGESIFLGNLAIDYEANRDFANLAVNWLLDRPQLLGGIGPKPVREYRITMTESQSLASRWILIAGLPGAVLVLGVLVWLRRRA
jgi:hypothetical protein